MTKERIKSAQGLAGTHRNEDGTMEPVRIDIGKTGRVAHLDCLRIMMKATRNWWPCLHTLHTTCERCKVLTSVLDSKRV